MQTITETMVREFFNISKEVQLCDEDAEAQWECFCKLHSNDKKEE